MSLVAEKLSLNCSGVFLLRDVNVSILPGKITTIVGPNGAGKTSLLRCLSNDILPTSGSIIFNGKDINNWDPIDRAKSLSVLTQHSSLDFPFTAEEVVLLARTPHDTGSIRDDEIVATALKIVDATYLANRQYTQLSGGEKQRIHLARSLAQIWDLDTKQKDHTDRFLLLDEPTSSFDLAHQQLTLEIVSSFSSRGVGILLVMHDLNLAAKCSDQVIMMECGKPVKTGLPKEVFTAENIEQVFGVRVKVQENPENKKLLIVI